MPTPEFASNATNPPRVYDMYSLGVALATLDFPANKLDIIRQHGKVELEWAHDDTMFLEDILREVHQERFESMDDLAQALCSVIRMSYGDKSVSNQTPIIQK